MWTIVEVLLGFYALVVLVVIGLVAWRTWITRDRQVVILDDDPELLHWRQIEQENQARRVA